MGDAVYRDSLKLPHWSVERWLLVGTFLVSILAFTFGIGVNWARLTNQEARQTALEQALETKYLPRELYAVDQRRLTESIDRLSRALERMEDRQEPRPATPGRMFDR
jgi:hypothetical protein